MAMMLAGVPVSDDDVVVLARLVGPDRRATTHTAFDTGVCLLAFSVSSRPAVTVVT
jgi:hypothetical protein